jgi:hypothetical protein
MLIQALRIKQRDTMNPEYELYQHYFGVPQEPVQENESLNPDDFIEPEEDEPDNFTEDFSE